MRSTSSNNGDSAIHCESVLQACIKKFIPSLDSECFRSCLNKKGQGFSAMMLQLVEDYGTNSFKSRNTLEKVVSQVGQKMATDHPFAQWIGESFKPVWIVLTVASIEGMSYNGVQPILESFVSNQPNCDDIPRFLLDIGTNHNLDNLQDSENLEYLHQKVIENQIWKSLQSSHLHPNPQEARALPVPEDRRMNMEEQEQEVGVEVELGLNNYENYQQMKADLHHLKDSKLDYFIQEYLVMAYGSQFLGRGTFGESHYQEFTKKFETQAKRFEVFTTSLKMELDEPPQNKKFYNKILSLRSKVHPVFVPELTNLLNKSKGAQSVIKDKDTIVLLGTSGAGKTTCIQVLLGYKLRKGFDQNGINTLLPTETLRKEHKEFVAKASSKSVTKYVTAISIDLKQYAYYQPMYLVDTPGFFDSGGLVVDACNSLSTIEVLGTANSIRFGFIFNYKTWGKRADAFKQFVKLISKLFKSYEKNKSRVIYLLNEFTDEEIESFPNRVREFRRNGLNQYEKGDKKLLQVVDHIMALLHKAESLKKSFKGTLRGAISTDICDQLILLDPISPNLEEIYEKFIKQERKLINPDLELDSVISEDVKKLLESEVNQLEFIIMSCIKNKDVEALRYYFKNLQKIAKITEHVNDCAQAKKRLEKIIEKIKSQYNSKFKTFKSCLGKIMNMNVDEETFTQYKQAREALEQMANKYSTLPGMENFSRTTEINQQISMVHENLITRARQGKICRSLYETVRLFSKYFSPNLINQFANIREKKQKEIIEKINQIIDSDQFQKFDEQYMNLEEIIKYRGDMGMGKEFNPKQLQRKAETKIEQVEKKYEKYIQDKKQCYTILQNSDIDSINSTLKTFQTKSNYLQKLQQSSSKIKTLALELFQQYISQMRNFKENKNQISPSDERKVFICRKNAIELKRIKQIQWETKVAFENLFSSINQEIRTGKQSLERLVFEANKENLSELRVIYRKIRRLQKLNLLCEPSQRGENNTIINSCQQLLQKKFLNFEDQIKFMQFTLQTYASHSISSQILSFYKQCSLIKEQHQKNNKRKAKLGHSENEDSNDKIVQVCDRIVENIKQKISVVLNEITGYIDSTMTPANQSQNISQINERMIAYYIRIVKFFQMIKRTDFSPPSLNKQINQTKISFENALRTNQQFFETFIIDNLNSILEMVIQENITGITRKNVEEIIKLSNMTERIMKVEGLKSIIKASDDLIDEQCSKYFGLSSKIDGIIFSILKEISDRFTKLHQCTAYQKCYEMINCCRILEGLDILHQRQKKFKALGEQFTQKICQDVKSYETSFDAIITSTKIENISKFKYVFNYYVKFDKQDKESLQQKRLASMIQHLRNLLKKEQKALVDKIKTLVQRTKFDKTLEERQISQIQQSFQWNWNTIKQINEITKKEELKIQVEEQHQKYFGQAFSKIFQYQIAKAKKLFQKKYYKDTLQTLKVIDTLQDIFQDFKIKSPNQSQDAEKKDWKKQAEQLRAKAEQAQQVKFNKYKKEAIIVDQKFSEEYQTFEQSQKKQIKKKIYQAYTKQINSTSMKYSKEAPRQIAELTKIKERPEFENLQTSIRDEIEQIINDKIQAAQSRLGNEQKKAESHYSFANLAKIMKEQHRPHIKQLYERKGREDFEKKLAALRVQRTSEQIRDIMSEVINIYREQYTTGNDTFKKLYQQFCENALKCIRECSILKKVNSLKKKLYYQKNMKALDVQIKFLVSEIKEILIHLHSFKEKLKPFNLKKELELLKILETFSNELMKKNELTFEQISSPQKQSVFYPWFYECRNFRCCCQSLEKMEEITELEEFNSPLFEKLELITSKSEELRNRFRKILDELKSTSLYNENLKNISDFERKEQLRKMQQKVNTLKCLQTLGEAGKEFFGLKQDIGKLIKDEVSQNIKKQIQSGISQSCQDVKNGFEDLQSEFNKEINVSMSLVTSASEIFTFTKIDKNIKLSLTTTIESCYKQTYEKIEKQVETILSMKQSLQDEMKKFLKNINDKKFELEENAKIKQQLMILDLKSKFDDKLKNQKDETKKKSIQQAHESQARMKKKQFWDQFQENLMKLEKEAEKKENQNARQLSSSFGKYCDLFATLYKAVLQINYKQRQYRDKIQSLLSDHKKVLGNKRFNLIYEVFKNKRNNYAPILVGSLEIFKSNQALQWIAKVKGNGIQYVLKQLNVPDSKKHSLNKLYEKYQQTFNSWTRKYQNEPNQMTINQLLQAIKNSSDKSRRFYEKQLSSDQFEPEILIAEILVLWTIEKSSIEDDTVEFSYQPHPAQVVTMFLTLSLTQGESPRDLISKMAQVKTGEGKSLILGGLCCYLALSGFEVSCVCYSEYLSARDYESFQKLFQKLRIQEKVMYGTFNTVCESLLNKSGKQGRFSDEIKKVLESQSQGIRGAIMNVFKSLLQNLLPKSLSKDKSQSKRIMLIDQVDVFFNPDYFGELYRPEVCISSSEIKELIQQVWKKYKQNPEITDAEIKESPEYKKAVKRFSKIENILSEQVKGMILGCRNCNHDYIIRDDRIQYKDNDGFSSKLNYGFSTKFAYLKEHDNNRIASIQKAFEVSLIIAEFSYAMLPSYFKSIIGVTGTYEEMPEDQKKYMQDQYQVKEFYIIPSVYGGQTRLEIMPEIVTEPENHWNAITKEVEAVHSTERPILVFFQSATELESFYNSLVYRGLQNKTTFLNETHSAGERDLRIKKTCQKGQITLMTKAFGRGTDFFVFDESIFRGGLKGLHVIQTFLSIENSEQIQIQGRTARQGDPGSYILIITKTDLERVQIGQIHTNFADQLKRARKRKQQKERMQTVKSLKQSKAKHEQSIKVYLSDNIKQTDIINHILGLNRYNQIRKRTCKTTIFFDGTVSMSLALKKLNGILEEVMNDISETIAKYPNAKQSQIQLGVYRNYNVSYSMILQTTSFENKPQNLLNFWKDVRVKGGMGNEAIEVAFHYLNSQKGIDQAILIGDAAANTDQETIQKRESFQQNGLVGELYWSKHVPVLSAERELQQIKQRKMPIHCYYIKANEYFKRVSKETGGVSQKFQIEDLDASKKMSHFIATRILNCAANNQAEAKQMMKQYELKDKKRYSS